MNCLFCAIINGDIPSKKVYEDDRCYAFLDIAPQAAVHCLVVPKEHIASADEITDTNASTVGHIFTVIPKIAKELGLEGGYRADVDLSKYHYIGNSSLTGAYAMVMSDQAIDKCHEVGANMTYLELSTYPGYMDSFVAACFLPHTDARLFPSSCQEV